MAGSETRFAVLFFTDIVGSTDLKTRHGVPAFREALATHNGHFERLAREGRGIRILQNMGDGYFAEGDSVAEVVKFALLFQEAMRAGPWGEIPLTTRVGIHAGELTVLASEGGSGIVAPAADLAARVMSLAAGGQILLTRFPFDEARHFLREHPPIAGRTMPPLRWLAHGPYLLMGRDEPMEIFEVGAAGLAPLTAPPDGEKARRAIRAGEEETLGWRPAVGLEVPGRAGWVLARKIGEGGFGEVWLAEQAVMRQRRVFKFCFDQERLRSFKRELTFFRLIRDALGERDDIARLYDVKLDEPPFFLESEFAEHGNLAEWCEEQGGIGAVPLPRRLELLAQVADAVAAAHSVGILHKDLKPQNVLMQQRADGAAAPQITDFGIGALADKAALSAHAITAAGFTVNTIVSRGSGSSMTRLYAPPEQLAGKPFTIQGDVYALGVILYQLVVADFTRALAPGWEREVGDDLLREDLAECLDGDPARRLPSATELAERLRSLETRRASREAEHQRAARYTRRKRNARLALAGGAVAAVAAIALGVGLFRERELRQRASTAEKLAHSRLGDAEKARDAAESLINEAVFGLRKKLLALGKVGVMEDMVAAADGYYRKLPPELFDDDARRHLASIALNRAMIAEALGQDVASEQHTREALRLTQELAVKNPGQENLQDELGRAMLTLCYTFMDRNDTAALMPMAEAITTHCQTTLEKNPKAIWAMHYEALAHGLAAQALVRYLGKPVEGFLRFEKAAQLAQRMRGVAGETEQVCEVEGFVHYGKANVAGKLGQKDRMISEFEISMSSFARALELGGDSALLREMHLGAMHHVGVHTHERAVEKKDAAEEQRAVEICQQALEGRRKLVELEPARAEWWRDLAHSYRNLGEWAGNKKDAATAVRNGRDSLRCRGEAIKRQPNRPLLYDERSVTCSALARHLLALDPPLMDEAGEIAVRALEDWSRGVQMAKFKWLGRDDDLIGDVKSLAATVSVGPEAALARLFRGRAALEPLVNKSSGKNTAVPAYIALMQCLADTLTKLGRTDDAASVTAELAKHKDAPDFLRVELRSASERTSKLMDAFRSAPAGDKAARLAEFRKHTRRVNEVSEKHPDLLPIGEQLGFRAHAHAVLGGALCEYEDFAEAESASREAVRLQLEKAPHEETAAARADATTAAYEWQSQLAYALSRLGRKDEEVKLRREAAEASEKVARETQWPPAFARAAARWRDYAWTRGGEELRAEKLAACLRATDLADTAMALDEPAHGNSRETSWLLHEAAWAWFILGDHQTWWREWTEAERALTRARALQEKAAAILDDFWRADLLVQIRWRYAQLLFATARPAEARAELDRAEDELRAFETRTGRAELRFQEKRQHLEKIRRESH